MVPMCIRIYIVDTAIQESENEFEFPHMQQEILWFLRQVKGP